MYIDLFSCILIYIKAVWVFGLCCSHCGPPGWYITLQYVVLLTTYYPNIIQHETIESVKYSFGGIPISGTLDINSQSTNYWTHLKTIAVPYMNPCDNNSQTQPPLTAGLKNKTTHCIIVVQTNPRIPKPIQPIIIKTQVPKALMSYRMVDSLSPEAQTNQTAWFKVFSSDRVSAKLSDEGWPRLESIHLLGFGRTILL